MKKLDNSKETELRMDELVEELYTNTFSIGQFYEEKPAKKIKCRKCGSDKFIVGIGDYYTAIKCPECKWEKCIHDG